MLDNHFSSSPFLQYKQWCKEMDKGVVPSEIEEALKIAKSSGAESSDSNSTTSMSDMDRGGGPGQD